MQSWRTTLDFERAAPEGSHFFPGGVLPESADELYNFVEKAGKLTPDGLAILADEVKSLLPYQIERFCQTVLPMLSTESLLAVIFLSPEVIREMPGHTITKAFSTLYTKKYDCYIRKEFFEQSLQILATHSPGSLSLLRDFMGQHHDKGDRAEWFLSPDADRAFAKQIVAQSASGLPSQGDARKQWEGLCMFELPETLGAFIQAKIVTGEAAQLIGLIGEMAYKNVLSDKYIAVVRKIVGDDFFLRSCKNDLPKQHGLLSTLQLAGIYGEAAIHDEEFLKGLHWGPNSDVPEYIKQFAKMYFSEQKLPLLANYVVSKMDCALKTPPDGARDIEFEVRFCDLAGRLGQGEKALHRVAQLVRPPDSDLRQPSRIFEEILEKQSAPAASRREQSAYSLAARAVGKLGLETLHKVAPDVSGRFVVDVLGGMQTELTTREIMKLFPQAKGDLLENDLGM